MFYKKNNFLNKNKIFKFSSYFRFFKNCSLNHHSGNSLNQTECVGKCFKITVFNLFTYELYAGFSNHIALYYLSNDLKTCLILNLYYNKNC